MPLSRVLACLMAVAAGAATWPGAASASTAFLRDCTGGTRYDACHVDWNEVDRAAGRGNLKASALVGWKILAARPSVSADEVKRAEAMLEKAADADEPTAALLLAKLNIERISNQSNPIPTLELAIGYAERASRLGAPGAKSLALIALANLAQVTRDPLTGERAARYLKELADENDPFVDVGLVQKLSGQKGPRQVSNLKLVLTRLAASTPGYDAPFRLYQLLKTSGIPDEEKDEALKWLFVAEALGDQRVANELASLDTLDRKEEKAARAAAAQWLSALAKNPDTGYATLNDWCAHAHAGNVQCSGRALRFYKECAFAERILDGYIQTRDFSNCMNDKLAGKAQVAPSSTQ